MYGWLRLGNLTQTRRTHRIDIAHQGKLLGRIELENNMLVAVGKDLISYTYVWFLAEIIVIIIYVSFCHFDAFFSCCFLELLMFNQSRPRISQLSTFRHTGSSSRLTTKCRNEWRFPQKNYSTRDFHFARYVWVLWEYLRGCTDVLRSLWCCD